MKINFIRLIKDFFEYFLSDILKLVFRIFDLLNKDEYLFIN